MSNTPLCDALRSFAARRPLRMHMPGHKGKPLPLEEAGPLAPLDFTELPPTGDLFAGGGPIGEAEGLWAEAFHMEHCLFLTGGSTQGVLSALTAACPPGSAVLLDRGSHRSAYHALSLLDLRPVYLGRPWLEEAALPGPIDPAEVDRALSAHPDVKTVCITSPTYYGILSDIPAIAAAAHRHGAVLAVDGAHGAHLPFLSRFEAAADLLVVSAHKTLPALGQGALLFSSGRFSHRELRRAASLYGSSSPSYPIMASLDAARAHLEGAGGAAYRRTAEGVAALREKLPALGETAGLRLDPCRLTLCCEDGFALQAALEERGIYPEMADRGHTVFICTCADLPEELEALGRTAAECLAHLSWAPPAPGAWAPPPEPELVLTPREAHFAPRELVPLGAAAERIAAQQIAPYPPGVPLAAPGERLTKKTVAYLEGIGYNMLEEIEVVRAGCAKEGSL